MPVSQLCLHSGAGTAAKLCHLPATDHGAVSCANAQLCPVSARAAFPTSGLVCQRCVTSSRSQSLPTPGLQHTYSLQLSRLTPGLAYTRTALLSQRDPLSLSGPRSVPSLQLPVGVSGLELVSLVLHSVSRTGASPVTVYIYSLCMYYVYGTNTYVLQPHLER